MSPDGVRIALFDQPRVLAMRALRRELQQAGLTTDVARVLAWVDGVPLLLFEAVRDLAAGRTSTASSMTTPASVCARRIFPQRRALCAGRLANEDARESATAGLELCDSAETALRTSLLDLREQSLARIGATDLRRVGAHELALLAGTSALRAAGAFEDAGDRRAAMKARFIGINSLTRLSSFAQGEAEVDALRPIVDASDDEVLRAEFHLVASAAQGESIENVRSRTRAGRSNSRCASAIASARHARATTWR